MRTERQIKGLPVSSRRESNGPAQLGGGASPGGGSIIRPDRKGKRIIAGHFTADTTFALQELLGQIGRQTGQRVTVQEAIGMGLALIFRRYRVEPPNELKPLTPPPCPRAKSKTSDPGPSS